MDLYGFQYGGIQADGSDYQYFYFEKDDNLEITDDGTIDLGEKPVKIDKLKKIANIIVKYNIEKLKNDPNFAFIKTKLNELADNCIATSGNDASVREFRRFYNITFEILLDCLKNADELYWYDKSKLKRSEYSFEECFKVSVDLALKILKMKKLVTDINLPPDLLQAEVSYAYSKRIKDRKTDIGSNYEKKSAKTVNKKGKTSVNSKSTIKK